MGNTLKIKTTESLQRRLLKRRVKTCNRNRETNSSLFRYKGKHLFSISVLFLVFSLLFLLFFVVSLQILAFPVV